MFKKRRSFASVISALVLGLFILPVGVYADEEDGVTYEDGTSYEEYTEGVTEGAYDFENVPESSSDADIGKAMAENMKITADELERGAEIAAPAAKIVRTLVATLLAFLSVVILATSIWDIVCISIRPLCVRVLASSSPNPNQPQDLMTKMASWASQEAVVAIQQAGGSAPQAGPSAGGGGMYGAGGGMYGAGGGMYGAGGGAGMNAQNAPKAKQILPIYLRKRVVFLVLFGVCTVVFCATAFTDLGIQIGNWVIERVSQIHIG